MRLLIIEDNKELSYLMKEGLEKYGFTIDVSNSGMEGEEKAYVNAYDTILLDLNLPDKDGIEILKFLRSSDIDIPIIIVTARDEVKQRSLGLDLGADDYLIKPFQMIELRARIQAVIRRYQGRSNPLITVGELVINSASRSALVHNIPVTFQAKEFDILEYLASRHPAVVSSEEIAEHVYDELFNPYSSVIRVHIARLRKKLYEVTGREILQTIRGKGYYLWEEQK